MRQVDHWHFNWGARLLYAFQLGIGTLAAAGGISTTNVPLLGLPCLAAGSVLVGRALRIALGIRSDVLIVRNILRTTVLPRIEVDRASFDGIWWESWNPHLVIHRLRGRRVIVSGVMGDTRDDIMRVDVLLNPDLRVIDAP